jgi:hypothetical protein
LKVYLRKNGEGGLESLPFSKVWECLFFFNAEYAEFYAEDTKRRVRFRVSPLLQGLGIFVFFNAEYAEFYAEDAKRREECEY